MIGDEPSTVVSVGREAVDHPGSAQRRLALRIVWHRDVQRVGELGILAADRSNISRKSPVFDPASDVVLSREPFLTVIDHGGPVEMQPRQTRMPIEINGKPFAQALTFSERMLLLAS